MKAAIFVQELLSVVLTPIILILSLPTCAPAIIDFFREFTVHIDTLGYVCSFAVFDFKRHGNIKFGAPSFGEPRSDENKGNGGWQEDERLQSKDGKMEKSFLAFKAAHPEWTPTDPTGSQYLERLREMHQDLSHPQHDVGGISRRSTAPAFGLGSTMHARSTLAERSELYEKALTQSMANARARRGMTGSLHTTAATSNPARRLVPQQGHTQLSQTQDLSHRGAYNADTAMQDDRAEDGGIGSELGDSYVDDVRMHGGRIVLDPRPEDELEAEELANGGVLGLLAQIYDRKRPVM